MSATHKLIRIGCWLVLRKFLWEGGKGECELFKVKIFLQNISYKKTYAGYYNSLEINMTATRLFSVFYGVYDIQRKQVSLLFRDWVEKEMQKKFHHTFTNLNNAYVIKVRVSPTNEIAQPT